MTIGHQKMLAYPQDLNRLGSVCNVPNMSWARIPTYYYDFRRHCLPLTQAEFNTDFGANIPVFNLDGQPGQNRQTNAAVGSGVNEAFMAMGAGVIAIGEGESWSIHGLSITPPAAVGDTPAVQLSVQTCDSYCGAARINASAGATLASLYWGGPTWKFIEKFFQSFRLLVNVNRRFEIVNESLFDVGMVPVPPEFVGASSSRVPTSNGIRAVNNQMRTKEIANLFLPPNFVLGESGASVCIPPPLAPVTYGHPRIIGLANRIYCFNQPILFLPGMRFDVNFQRVDGELCYNDMEVVSTVQTHTADALVDADVVGPGGTAVCGTHVTIPGGSLSLGVVFKGMALWPQAAIEYLANFTTDGSALAGVYNQNAVLAGWLASGKFGSMVDKDGQGLVGKVNQFLAGAPQG
jgi:hypothetical protein